MEHTITRKSRKIGWGYTFVPDEPPTEPDYVSTIKIILDKRDKDKTWNAHKNCYSSQMWFYDGKPIKKVNGDERYSTHQFEYLAEGDIDTLKIEV